MPGPVRPGVHVQGIPSGVRPIEGVCTSTAAFIGITEKGPSPGTTLPNGKAAEPVMVTSFAEYLRVFGGYRVDSFLTYAVKAFFDNGGGHLYVIRVLPREGAARLAEVARLVTSRPGSPELPILAANEGEWGNSLWVAVDDSADAAPDHFRLTVMMGTNEAEARQNVLESYDGVTFKTAGAGAVPPPNYVGALVNDRSEYIAFNPDVEVTGRPSNTAAPVRLEGGADGSTEHVDFLGSAATDDARTGTGLYALDKIADVNLIAIPGAGGHGTVNKGMAYCKNERPLQDCFFIGDAGAISNGDPRRDGASTDVRTVNDAKLFATRDMDKAVGDYGAVYFPWVWAADPIGSGRNPRILLPPSGFVAGIYARTDNSRGVFKAPAGTEAGLAGAIAPASEVSDAEQHQLNPVNLNVIRRIPGKGLVLWGSRTMGSDPEWRYIPVRRMAIFLRTSIFHGIQWAVFEPNGEPLWASLRLNIGAFMMTQFRAGAFQGNKPETAFFVKCDSSTTTQGDIDNGRLNILVGFAALKAGEFVVFRISQTVGQPPT
jgi:uncharacterized protein